ncbi:MAG TPA: hypothetical protein VFU15_09420 [Bacteroidia bacterium]|nr:hypothetical protein [Bacteroidia bacterium]
MKKNKYSRFVLLSSAPFCAYGNRIAFPRKKNPLGAIMGFVRSCLAKGNGR